MPIIRKIIAVGKTSKAVIIPKSWLQYCERQQGCPINAVAIEVNEALRITPMPPEKPRDAGTHTKVEVKT